MPISGPAASDPFPREPGDSSTFYLPFDQFQRYRIVQQVVDGLRQGDEKFRILDVGGYPCQLLDFLPDDDVLVIDQVDDQRARYQQADALNLPFEDRAFDIAVSVDVYEHIKPEQRLRFLQELDRVSRRVVLLAAPFDNSEVRMAEKALDTHDNELLHLGNNFIAEHLENGLPDTAMTEKFFADKGYPGIAVLPNGYLYRWLPMIMLHGNLIKSSKNRVFLEHINHFYNTHFFEYDNKEPSYRHLVVAVKDASLASSLDDLKDRILGDTSQDIDIMRLQELQNLGFIALFGAQALVIDRLEEELLAKKREIAFKERSDGKETADCLLSDLDASDPSREASSWKVIHRQLAELLNCSNRVSSESTHAREEISPAFKNLLLENELRLIRVEEELSASQCELEKVKTQLAAYQNKWPIKLYRNMKRLLIR